MYKILAKQKSYHHTIKVRVCIGTLKVTSFGPFSAIIFPHINYTRTVTRALWPLMPRWKEATVPPLIGFTIYSQSFAT
jgi:hypothetical protein